MLLCSGAFLLRYLTPRRSTARTVLVTAAVADVPGDGALIFAQERVALLKSVSDYRAVRLICTHLGCTVTAAADGFHCPCHGSRFDRQGMVLRGPATVPLQNLNVEEQHGVLTVYGV